MDANLDSDFQVIEGFLKKIQEIIEKQKGNDARAELARLLLKEYKSNNQLNCRVVSEKYAGMIEDTLIKNNIPMMSCKDSAGNTIFMLPEEGKFQYEKLFQSVYMRYPDYYKQITPENFYLVANADKGDSVIEVKFDNETDANIFINKAYDDGKGFITTDIKNADGTVSVYLLEKDFINQSNQKDFVDALIDTEVSRSHQNVFRELASNYDTVQLGKCIRDLRDGKDFCLYNACSTTSNYLQFRNGVLSWNEYDKVSKTFAPHVIEVGDLTNPKDRDALKKTLSYHLATIHNATHENDFDELTRHLAKDEASLQSEYFDKQVDVFCKYAGAEFDTKEVAKKLDARPEFSIEFLKQYEKETENDLNRINAELSSISSYLVPVIALENGEVKIKRDTLGNVGIETVLEEDYTELLLNEAQRQGNLESVLNQAYEIEGLFEGYELNLEKANEDKEKLRATILCLSEKSIQKASELNGITVRRSDFLNENGEVNEMTTAILSDALILNQTGNNANCKTFMQVKESAMQSIQMAKSGVSLEATRKDLTSLKDILGESIQTESSNKALINSHSKTIHEKLSDAELSNPFMSMNEKRQLVLDEIKDMDGVENKFVVDFDKISIAEFGEQIKNANYDLSDNLEMDASQISME